MWFGRLDGWASWWVRMWGWMDKWLRDYGWGWLDEWIAGTVDEWENSWMNGLGWIDGWESGWVKRWLIGWEKQWVKGVKSNLTLQNVNLLSENHTPCNCCIYGWERLIIPECNRYFSFYWHYCLNVEYGKVFEEWFYFLDWQFTIVS